ncbi:MULTISPECIES: hypothetical protein [Mesorhizobium]|nr:MULTISPECIES: hypothetical protein [Mesorhizobium]
MINLTTADISNSAGAQAILDGSRFAETQVWPALGVPKREYI